MFMKQVIVVLICFGSLCAHAQTGLFLQSEVGAGTSTAKIKSPTDIATYPWGLTWQTRVKTIVAYSPKLLVGYQYHHWRLTTGIAFTKTGYTVDTAIGGLAGFAGLYFKETQFFYHLQLPLYIGYTLNLGQHFFCDPEIGGGLSYNFASKIEKTNYNMLEAQSLNRGLTQSEFSKFYNPVSYWGMGRVQFGYKASERLSIVAGPEVEVMLSSMLKDKANSQKSINYTFNAGIIWHCNKTKQLPKDNTLKPDKTQNL